MIDPKQTIEELANKLFQALPDSLQTFERELQHKFKDILQSAFARLDLITREEFDVQCKVLMRTREKLETLEKEILALRDAKFELKE